MSGWNRWDCWGWDWVGGHGAGGGIRPPSRNSPMSRLLPRHRRRRVLASPSFSSAAELTLSPPKGLARSLAHSVHSRSPGEEGGGAGGGGGGGDGDS